MRSRTGAPPHRGAPVLAAFTPRRGEGFARSDAGVSPLAGGRAARAVRRQTTSPNCAGPPAFGARHATDHNFGVRRVPPPVSRPFGRASLTRARHRTPRAASLRHSVLLCPPRQVARDSGSVCRSSSLRSCGPTALPAQAVSRWARDLLPLELRISGRGRCGCGACAWRVGDGSVGGSPARTTARVHAARVG